MLDKNGVPLPSAAFPVSSAFSAFSDPRAVWPPHAAAAAAAHHVAAHGGGPGGGGGGAGGLPHPAHPHHAVAAQGATQQHG